MRCLMALMLAAALAAPALADERCLLASQIDGFQDASRNAVTLTAGSRKFQVTFIGACIGLDSALNVAAVSATSCFGAGDTLTFDDGGFPQRCIARDVSYIPKDAPPAETKAD